MRAPLLLLLATSAASWTARLQASTRPHAAIAFSAAMCVGNGGGDSGGNGGGGGPAPSGGDGGGDDRSLQALKRAAAAASVHRVHDAAGRPGVVVCRLEQDGRVRRAGGSPSARPRVETRRPSRSCRRRFARPMPGRGARARRRCCAAGPACGWWARTGSSVRRSARRGARGGGAAAHPAPRAPCGGSASQARSSSAQGARGRSVPPSSTRAGAPPPDRHDGARRAGRSGPVGRDLRMRGHPRVGVGVWLALGLVSPRPAPNLTPTCEDEGSAVARGRHRAQCSRRCATAVCAQRGEP